MKELSIEEKAKAYDEAIKRLEDIETGKCQKTFVFTEGLFDYIFPELKESEDERIRKELIAHCRNIRCVTEEGDESIAKWIAWLEKQGEQKSTWSEEDEEQACAILVLLEESKKNYIYVGGIENSIRWFKERLKSLRPQSTWKPSDTEINILQGVIDGSFKPENVKVTLTNILEQLKKLKE